MTGISEHPVMTPKQDAKTILHRDYCDPKEKRTSELLEFCRSFNGAPKPVFLREQLDARVQELESTIRHKDKLLRHLEEAAKDFKQYGFDSDGSPDENPCYRCAATSIRSIGWLQEGVRRAVTVDVERQDIWRRRFLEVPWVDYQAVPAFSDQSLKDFGKECWEAEILSAPFRRYVSVRCVESPNGTVVHTAALMVCEERTFEPIAHTWIMPSGHCFIFPHNDGGDDTEFELLAFLEQRAAEVEKSRKPAGMGDSSVGDDYWIVRLRKHIGTSESAGGSHSSPRLHWRRGHLRHLRSGAITKVRPTLVGSAGRGIITKDYRA